jgi:hypothetical protein
MKKNLSIITSLLLSAPLFADNLSDAFTNSKVNGEIKAAYVDSNFLGAANSDDISAIGGNINLKTGSFYGLSAGVTFQSSSIINKDITSGGTKADSFNGSGAVMSEAYLNYIIANSSFKIGRQFINTPLVSSALDGKSSEALIKDSFEAYTLINTDIPNTTLVASYVDKYQALTDASGNIGTFKQAEDGAYTIYAKNTSIQNLTLQAQYLKLNSTTTGNDKNALYFQADYQFGPQTLSAQYLASTDKSQASSAQDGKLFGLKASGPLGISNFGYLIAYNSSTDKNGSVYSGVGEGTSDTPFTAVPVHGGGVPTRPDTDTLVGALVLPAADTTFIPYYGKSFSKTHVLGDVIAYGAMFIYPVAKNLLFKINYERVECEKIITKDTNTTRVYLSYKF